MTNAREEQQMSNENDEQNRAEETCPRCAGCGQLADSGDREPWSVWMALPVGSALAVTMGEVKPEPCDECGGTGKTQPAGEHHTGTLDLTGEGNAEAPHANDAAIEATAAQLWDEVWSEAKPWDEAGEAGKDECRRSARTILEAAYPAIRQQVAEEIAVALEAEALSDYDAADDLRWAAAKAREIGGVACKEPTYKPEVCECPKPAVNLSGRCDHCNNRLPGETLGGHQ